MNDSLICPSCGKRLVKAGGEVSFRYGVRTALKCLGCGALWVAYHKTIGGSTPEGYRLLSTAKSATLTCPACGFELVAIGLKWKCDPCCLIYTAEELKHQPTKAETQPDKAAKVTV